MRAIDPDSHESPVQTEGLVSSIEETQEVSIVCICEVNVRGF